MGSLPVGRLREAPSIFNSILTTEENRFDEYSVVPALELVPVFCERHLQHSPQVLVVASPLSYYYYY